MLNNTQDWWTLLRAIAGLNLLAWAGVAWWLWRRRDQWPPDTWLGRRWQLLLSAGYVLGCSWRALVVDSFWSSVVVGRSVATIAELCLAAQWAKSRCGASAPRCWSPACC